MNKYLNVCIIIIIVTILIYPNYCLADNQIADYYVHEWGVMVGCDRGENFFLTSRPMQVVAVREPVLYFHSNDKRPFSLKVTFINGLPTETYPDTEKSENTIFWENVTFTEQTRSIRRKRDYPDRLVYSPIKNIISTLNDVDSDELCFDGVKSKFLFYEGEMPFYNKIKHTYNSANQEAVIFNNADYPIFDVFIISSQAGQPSFRKKFLTAYIPSLKSNQQLKVKLSLFNEEKELSQSLNDLGFTYKETKSFHSLWKESILNHGKLFYRLPKQEINKLIRLEFVPEPKKIIRALYVLIK